MNLLTDPLFRVVTPDGQTTMSLPALLAALGRDKVESLTGLKRHQEDAFLVFLSQLGAGVLARTGESKPARDEKFWRDSIREVTGRKDDLAWTLVVEDVTKPAFMQAPLPPKVKLTEKATSPDELDILVTARNHDLKMTRVSSSSIEDWIYSLISLQTTTCYLGNGNYGVVRMKGRQDARPFVEFRSSNRIGKLWNRNVTTLLHIRNELLEGNWKYKEDGLLFTWLKQWDLTTPIALKELDPFFIETARAYRFTALNRFTLVVGERSKGERIDALNQLLKDNRFLNIGDPWIPIDRQDGCALKVSESGFTPELVCEILGVRRDKDGGEIYKRPAMMSPIGLEAGPMWFYASSLARIKQAKTRGFHSIRIRIPSPVKKSLFGSVKDRDEIATKSNKGLHNAETMWGKVLRPALLTFLKGGPPPPKNVNKKSEGKAKDRLGGWLKETEQRFKLEWGSEDKFYDWLWNSAGEEENAAIKRWAGTLRDIATNIFEDSIKRLPSRTGRQMRSVVRAESVFKGSLYNNFPMLRKETTDAGNS